MDTPRLVMLPVSPWSERARWALDHHKIRYKIQVHVPFLGERKLRAIVGPGPERATVPVLLAGGEVLRESTDIARYAEAHGAGAPLFPAGREAEIAAWIERANALMAEGRPLVSAALLSSQGALDESLPPGTPRWLRPLLRPLTRYGAAWFAKKWSLRLEDGEAQRQKLREGLLAVRAALGPEPSYLLGGFTYADIAIASCLQGISPVEGPFIPLGPGMRAVWTQPELAAEFADLVAWRDRLYAAHRPARTR